MEVVSNWAEQSTQRSNHSMTRSFTQNPLETAAKPASSPPLKIPESRPISTSPEPYQ